MEPRMSDGFLGYNATLMLDVVVCALVVVVPTLLFSLFAVKIRRNYRLHKALQITLGVVLLVVVGLFEIDMRIHGGIDGILARRSRLLSQADRDSFYVLLGVHLFFAVSTVVLWATTLALALKRMPDPPGPCEHSRLHKRLGWLSAVDITLTSVTGLMVYYYGFVVP
jgi:putative membrane protein